MTTGNQYPYFQVLRRGGSDCLFSRCCPLVGWGRAENPAVSVDLINKGCSG